MAYLVDAENVLEVLKYLDHREKGGYTSCKVKFFPRDSPQKPFEMKVYIASPENEDYLGPAPLDDIAKQIATSKGPSGYNYEYLLNLANAVRTRFPNFEDTHLFELEKKVKELLRN